MKRFQLTAIAFGLALAAPAWAQTATVTTTTVTTTSTAPAVSSATSSYIKRTAPRFESFAGSSDNYTSLASGLRSGSQITLTGSGEKVVFTSPTKPMGYGNVTRAVDLAQRQLAAQGITNPTPTQLQAALTGGTITNANGTVTYAGVLQLRSQGMGWGQIAHNIGVHPGMGKSTSAAMPASSSSGVTSAAGGSVAASGRTTGKPTSPGAAGREQARISTAAGGSAAMQGSGRGLGNAGSMSSAAGGSASAGGAASAGGGGGNAFGRGK